MKQYDVDLHEIKKKLKKELDKNRYEHTKGVMNTCISLAMAYGYDMNKALLGGLLHDCAKCIPHEEKMRLCQEYHITLSPAEQENPALIHAKLGAVLAEELYGIRDPEILHAIKVHTTGEPNMNLLDKIVFVADYIEPGRDSQPHLYELRQIAFRDIDSCIAEILNDTLLFLKKKHGIIDSMTELTYQYYKPYEKEQPWKH